MCENEKNRNEDECEEEGKEYDDEKEVKEDDYKI
jgi:hypothetical protein